MIDKLRLSTSESEKKAIVVIDAGIATEENLAMIVEKGYDYVCVSCRNLKKYNNIKGKNPANEELGFTLSAPCLRVVMQQLSG